MSSRKIHLNQLMTQAMSRRVESIQPITQVAFQGIDPESTHDSGGSPGIDSDRLMTQAAIQGTDSESTHDSSRSPGIDSNRLMTQAKNIWFWVVPWFNSGSYPCPTRIKEHKNDIRNHRTTKAVVHYADEAGHLPKWNDAEPLRANLTKMQRWLTRQALGVRATREGCG